MELITGCIILDATPRHESDNRFLWEGTLGDHWRGYAHNTGWKVPCVSGTFDFRCTKAVSLWSCLITFLFLCLCRPDCYWWKGQNKRTSEVGTFPRHCVDPQRKLGGQCQKGGGGGCTLTPTYTLCRTSLICKNYFEMPLF